MPTSIVGARVMKTMQEGFSRGGAQYLRAWCPRYLFRSIYKPKQQAPARKWDGGDRTV